MAKKTDSELSARGRASVKKGRNFEKRVADLFKLLGAEVTTGIEIRGKKVDILAQLPVPGSRKPMRVIVECKNERNNRNQTARIREFESLLRDARRENEADALEFVTHRPMSEVAKGVAHKQGIEVLTYDEKMATLINFGPYLQTLVRRFSEDRTDTNDAQRTLEPALGKYYVPVSAEDVDDPERQEIQLLDYYVLEWASKDVSNHLAVLGEFGSGKTSLCLKIACDMARDYLDDPGSCRIPILLNLANFRKANDIEAMITSFLDRECQVTNPRFGLFQAMNEAGKLVIILDGYDEMQAGFDQDIDEMNLRELDKLARPSRAKLLITSRSEYFMTGLEENQCFFLREPLWGREVIYKRLRIIPWNDEHIDNFLKKRVRLTDDPEHPWEYYAAQIRRSRGLYEMSKKPVFADMIVKTLPAFVSKGAPIDMSRLYEEYLKYEMRRQKISKKRTLELNQGQRMLLLGEIATYMYRKDALSVPFDVATQIVSGALSPDPVRGKLDGITRELLAYSFLARREDRFQFYDRIMMHYFVAKRMRGEINANCPDMFGSRPIPDVVADFLIKMGVDWNFLWPWIAPTSKSDRVVTPYAGGNLIRLLTRRDRLALTGEDLSNSVLRKPKFFGADLRRTKFNGALIECGDFCAALFSKDQFESTQLKDCTFSIHLYMTIDGSVINDIGQPSATPFHLVLQELVGKRYRRTISAHGGLLQGFRLPVFASSGGGCFTMLAVQVRALKSLQDITTILASDPTVKATATFACEMENLLSLVPSRLQKQLKTIPPWCQLSEFANRLG